LVLDLPLIPMTLQQLCDTLLPVSKVRKMLQEILSQQGSLQHNVSIILFNQNATTVYLLPYQTVFLKS